MNVVYGGLIAGAIGVVRISRRTRHSASSGKTSNSRHDVRPCL